MLKFLKSLKLIKIKISINNKIEDMYSFFKNNENERKRNLNKRRRKTR